MSRSGMMSSARPFALLAAALSFLFAGCVERRLVIRSNPPGAEIFVDDHDLGTVTPAALSTIYYGNRKIRLVKDGFETKTVIVPVPPPWYEIPPLDFFSENTMPGTLHDTRTLDFQLEPQRVVPQEELLARAEGLRRGTPSVSGVAAPAWRVNPPAARPEYVVPAGAPGGVPVGSQPYYQLPPGAAAAPAIPSPNVAPAIAPAGPPAYGPIYQPPSLPPSGPAGSGVPSGVGSQPFYPLPPGS